MSRVPVSIRASSRDPWLQVCKTLLAAVLTWYLCAWLFPAQTPIFGTVAALLCVQQNVSQSLLRGVERVSGVILGAAVAYAALFALGNHDWVVVVALAAALSLGWLLRMNTAATNQVAITAMLVLALGTDGGTDTDAVALGRIIETLLGALIGVALNASIAAPVSSTTAHLGVRGLGHTASMVLDALGASLQQPGDAASRRELLRQSQELIAERERVRDLVGAAKESLALNPRGWKHRGLVEQDAALMRALSPIVTRLAGMVQALVDHYDASLHDDPAVHGIAEECHRAAHDLRLNAQVRADLAPEDAPTTSEIPALTAPFAILQPNPQHWLLIGSLMEDLGRIRSGIVQLSEQAAREPAPRRRGTRTARRG